MAKEEKPVTLKEIEQAALAYFRADSGSQARFGRLHRMAESYLARKYPKRDALWCKLNAAGVLRPFEEKVQKERTKKKRR